MENMNKSIDCIFVKTGDHPALEKMIAIVTGSPYTHAALRLNIHGKDRLVESKMPAFRIVDGEIYDEKAVLDVITLPVTDLQNEAIVEMAFALTGMMYGFDDCVTGAVRDLCSDRFARLLGCLDHEGTVNCSAALVTMLRAAWPDFMPNVQAETVTPGVARDAVYQLKSEIEVSSE